MASTQNIWRTSHDLLLLTKVYIPFTFNAVTDIKMLMTCFIGSLLLLKIFFVFNQVLGLRADILFQIPWRPTVNLAFSLKEMAKQRKNGLPLPRRLQLTEPGQGLQPSAALPGHKAGARFEMECLVLKLVAV